MRPCTSPPDPDHVRLGSAEVDLKAFALTRDGTRVTLSRLERVSAADRAIDSRLSLIGAGPLLCKECLHACAVKRDAQQAEIGDLEKLTGALASVIHGKEDARPPEGPGIQPFGGPGRRRIEVVGVTIVRVGAQTPCPVAGSRPRPARHLIPDL